MSKDLDIEQAAQATKTSTSMSTLIEVKSEPVAVVELTTTTTTAAATTAAAPTTNGENNGKAEQQQQPQQPQTTLTTIIEQVQPITIVNADAAANKGTTTTTDALGDSLCYLLQFQLCFYLLPTKI